MKKLDLLKKVRRVEAPAFMYTRIQTKIRAATTERLPVSWQWASGLAFSILVLGNVFYFSKTENLTQQSSVETLAQSMQLQSENQFYNE
jgi:hypothetical protein